MTFHRKPHLPLAGLTAAGLLIACFGIGQRSTAQAQNAPVPPPVRRDLGPGDTRRPPSRPDDEPVTAPPLDPAAAPAAVKVATAAVAAFAPGQVWTKVAPHGETQLQAAVLFQDKEVARLEFDPVNGTLLPRGVRSAPPRSPGPNGGPADQAPQPPAPDGPGVPAPLTAALNGPAPIANSMAPDQVKTRLPEIIKGLSVGQGAEVVAREGCWKVPLIYQNRVVGELRVSADGQRVIPDFAAAHDAAIFSRN